MYEQTSMFDADQALRGRLDRADEYLVQLDLDHAERLFAEVLAEADGPGVFERETIAAQAADGLRFARTWKSTMESVEALEREDPSRAARVLYEEIPSADAGGARQHRRFRQALIRHLIAMLERHELFFVEANVAISDLWLGLGRPEEAWRSLKAAVWASAERLSSTRAFGGPCARYAETASARDRTGRLRIEHTYALQAAALAALLDPSAFREGATRPEAITALWREHGLHAASYGAAREELPVVEIPDGITLVDEEHRRAVHVYRLVTELERDWEDAARRVEWMKRLREAHPDLFEVYVRRLRR